MLSLKSRLVTVLHYSNRIVTKTGGICCSPIMKLEELSFVNFTFNLCKTGKNVVWSERSALSAISGVALPAPDGLEDTGDLSCE